MEQTIQKIISPPPQETQPQKQGLPQAPDAPIVRQQNYLSDDDLDDIEVPEEQRQGLPQAPNVPSAPEVSYPVIRL